MNIRANTHFLHYFPHTKLSKEWTVRIYQKSNQRIETEILKAETGATVGLTKEFWNTRHLLFGSTHHFLFHSAVSQR